MSSILQLIDDLRRVEREGGYVFVGVCSSGVGKSEIEMFFPVPAEFIGIEPIDDYKYAISIETGHKVSGCEDTTRIQLEFSEKRGFQYSGEREIKGCAVSAKSDARYTLSLANSESELEVSIFIGSNGIDRVAPDTFQGERQEKIVSYQ
jgi:hypothetical protein